MKKITILCLLIAFSGVLFAQSKSFINPDYAQEIQPQKQLLNVTHLDIKTQSTLGNKDLQAVEDTLYHDLGLDNAIGAGGGVMSVYAEFDSTDLAPFIGKDFLEIMIGLNDSNFITDVVIEIYTDTAAAPAYTLTTPPGWVNGWNLYTLAPPFAIDGTPLFVGYSCAYTEGYVAGCDPGPSNPKGDWTLWNGEWLHLTDLSATLTYNWNIRMLVGTPDACPQPYELSVDTVGLYAATVSWTTGGAFYWNLIYGPAGFNPDSAGTFMDSVIAPYTIAGLDQNTAYDFYVQDSCGVGSISPWSYVGTFVTNATCPIPSNLAAANFTATSADVSWTTGGAANWNVYYGTAGFDPETEGTFVEDAANPYSITGLIAGNYQFYVQDSCGAGDVSDWVGPYDFIISNCDDTAKCNFGISMVDSYGDGWNNAYIEVVENGVSIGMYTVADGFGDSITIALCDSLPIDLVWISGDWDSEISFTVFTPFGTQVVDVPDGDALTDGAIFHSFTAMCTAPAQPDLTVMGMVNSEYPVVPVSQVTGYDFDVDVTNNGAELTAATDVVLSITGDSYTDNVALTVPMAAGASQSLSFSGTYMPVMPAMYEVVFNADVANDLDPMDNADTSYFIVSDTVYAREDGSSVTGALGFGAGAEGFFGQQFDIVASGYEMTSVSMFLMTPPIGLVTRVDVYDDNAGQPGNVVGTTGDYTVTAADSSGFMTISLQSPVTLTPGMYYIIAHEEAAVDGLGLGTTTAFYIPGTTWVSFDGVTWGNSEDYNFMIAYILRANINIMSDAGFAATTPDVNIYPNPTNGSVNITNADNGAIYVYNLVGELMTSVQNAQSFNTVDLSSFAQGTYVIKVVTENNVVTSKVNYLK